MCPLDDVENGALVEVGLGQDHLVRADGVDDLRQVDERSPEQRKPELAGRGDDADDLVGDAAARRRRAARCSRSQALAGADEHDPAADARQP